MSFSISGLSNTSPDVDSAPALKATAKLSENEQIKQLAEQGQSTKQIANSVGLPESIVALTLGDTTSTTSSTSSASALVALSGRLSVHA